MVADSTTSRVKSLLQERIAPADDRTIQSEITVAEAKNTLFDSMKFEEAERLSKLLSSRREYDFVCLIEQGCCIIKKGERDRANALLNVIFEKAILIL